MRNPRGENLVAVPAEEFARRYGFMAVMHRADLLALLMREVDPARLHLDRECVAIDPDERGVTAHFRNGETVRGAVLVGADGLRSQVRTGLFGLHPPRYAGYTAWRAVASLGGDAAPAIQETWERGRRFGIVPITGGRLYWFATRNTPEGERDPAGAVKAGLLECFKGWHAPIEALIEATAESSILRNDIYDLEPLPAWSRGRVTLLGDAAHPMTPNLGQGACQAIEDAVVLAVCLKKAERPEDALAEYQRRRIPRARSIVIESRRIGALGQWEGRWTCALRDRALRATPRALMERSMIAVAAFPLLTDAERLLLQP